MTVIAAIDYFYMAIVWANIFFLRIGLIGSLILTNSWQNYFINLFLAVPFGTVPTLEVDGVKVCQSMAINRYLAKMIGIAGKDHFQQCQVDMIIDHVMDLWQNSKKYFESLIYNYFS